MMISQYHMPFDMLTYVSLIVNLRCIDDVLPTFSDGFEVNYT